VESTTCQLKEAKEIARNKELLESAHETISKLQEELGTTKMMVKNLTADLGSAQSRSKQAESQFERLKSGIDELQSENDKLKVSNEELIGRLVSEKEKAVEQMNLMNEMGENIKKELDMLRSWKQQAEEREKGSLHANFKTKHKGKWVGLGGSVPSMAKYVVNAHSEGGTCVRCANDLDWLLL